jgi:hypothetical protein
MDPGSLAQLAVVFLAALPTTGRAPARARLPA